MDSLANKSLRWMIVAILLFVLISALRFGIAEIFSLNARSSMVEWRNAKLPPATDQIDAVSRQFELALFLASSNPDHHENIARLSLIRAAMPGIAPDEKRIQLALGLVEIRTAITLRPVSPYSWTLLLLLKRDLHEFDAEFRQALHNAVALGPWEPELLTELADVGLSAWDAMPPEEQALIQHVFVRGFERQDDLMRDVADAHRNACAEQAVACQ